MPRINGYTVTVEQTYRDPDDEGWSGGPPREGYDPAKPFAGTPHPKAKLVWFASISNKWYHETTLGPFDTEQAATKAAKKWTADQKKHTVLR